MPSISHSFTSRESQPTTRRGSASYLSTDSGVPSSRLLISLQVELPNKKEEEDTILPAFLTQGLRSKKKEIPTPTSSAGRQIFDKVNVIREIWQKHQPPSSSASAGALPSGTGSAPASEFSHQEGGAEEAAALCFTPPSSSNLPSTECLRPSTEVKGKRSSLPGANGGLVPLFPSLSYDAALRRGSADSSASLKSDAEGHSHSHNASTAASGMAMFSQRSISGPVVQYPERATTVPRSRAGPLETAPPANATSPTTPFLSNGFRGSMEKKRNIIYQNHHNVLAHPPSPAQLLLLSSSGLTHGSQGEGTPLTSTTPKQVALGEGTHSLPVFQNSISNTKEVHQEKREKKSTPPPSLLKQQEQHPTETPSGDLSSSLSLVSRFSEQVNQQVAHDVYLDNFGFYMSREEKAGETALLRDPAHRKVDRQWISAIFPKWDKWSMQERKKYCRLGVPPSFRPQIWRALLGVERRDDLQERGAATHTRVTRKNNDVLPAPPPLFQGKEKSAGANGSSNDVSGGRSRTTSRRRTAPKAHGEGRGEGVRRSLVTIEEYDALCLQSWPSELEEKFGRVIERDIPRTFSTNIFFDSSSCVSSREQDQLRRVLRAYCLRNKTIRYCQGMASVAATFLLVMEEEYEAFLCFTVIMEKSPYALQDYYAPGFPELERSSFVLTRLTEELLPSMHHVLEKNHIPFNVFATPWMLTVFSHCFNFRLVCRIWDMFLCEGWKPVYRVILGLLKMEQNTIKNSANKDFISVSMILQHATERKDPDTLLKLAQEFNFSTKEMCEYRSQYKPPA